jgi:NAD(P)-dependent dehydrogenase (short-subunit alcohol dehydrogenase family)
MTNLANSIPFVTGSNRGLGRALVDGLLACGVTRLYAASRAGTPHPDARVIPIRLDVTNPAQIAAAATAARDATLLINNAGSLASYSVLTADRTQLAQDLDINFHGPLALVRAFLPALELAKDATIVNVLSVVSLASMPGIGGYSASKAAAWSLTQSLRGELRAKGVRVHAVFPGPIDTDMIRAMDMPKTGATDVARAILDGLAAGVDDIAPDPMSAEVFGTFVRDPRAVEKKFAGEHAT